MLSESRIVQLVPSLQDLLIDWKLDAVRSLRRGESLKVSSTAVNNRNDL